IWRRAGRPALYEARPKWYALAPAMSVRSRSKNAAACRPELLLPGVAVIRNNCRHFASEMTGWINKCRHFASEMTGWVKDGRRLPRRLSQTLCAIHLDDHGVTLAAARADRGASE